jgi:hypothetical protein
MMEGSGRDRHLPGGTKKDQEDPQNSRLWAEICTRDLLNTYPG